MELKNKFQVLDVHKSCQSKLWLEVFKNTCEESIFTKAAFMDSGYRFPYIFVP